MCNAWWMSENETYLKQKKHTKAEEHVGWRFGVRKRGFGRWRNRMGRKRSRKMKLKSRRSIYIEFHNSWWIKSYRELKRRETAIEPAIEELSRGFQSKEARWIEIAIEKLSSIQNISRWIEVAIKSYRECDKKQLKGLDR